MRRAEQLTPRQLEIIRLVRRGLSNSEIAGALGISEDGVKAHLSRLYLRFGASNRVALVTAVDDRGDGLLSAKNLGQLREIADRSADRSRVMSTASGGNGVIVARDALNEVEVALRLLRELPPETTGPMLDALRMRIAKAVAALDDSHASTAPAKAV